MLEEQKFRDLDMALLEIAIVPYVKCHCTNSFRRADDCNCCVFTGGSNTNGRWCYWRKKHDNSAWIQERFTKYLKNGVTMGYPE